MNKKFLTIILAVILIGCFFLPITSNSAGGSAFDIVTGPSLGNGIQLMLMKYLWILVPLSGVILLIGVLNNGNYFLGRGIWAWLPLLTLIYIIVRPVIDGAKIEDMIKVFGIGFWVMLAASLVLAFYNPKSKA